MTASTSDVLLDPYDYDFHEDPYPYYRRLRDEAPLYRNVDQKFWALSRHADVVQGFRNSTSLSNKHGVSLDPISRNEHAHRVMSFLALDDPGHLRLRTLVSKGFTPRRIRELESRVTEIAVHHLDTALQSDHFDYVDDFAGKLPMDVISELMGVPESDRVRIRALADGVMHRDDGVKDVPPEAIQASADLMVYYADMVSSRRAKLTDDLTSALVEAEIDGDKLTDEEIIAFLFLMVVAGNETTTKLLANALFHLGQHPDQLTDVFANDDGLVGVWIEETLRHDTSSQMLARHLRADVALHGQVAPAGSKLLILLGSANRDERVFTDPTSYDVHRDKDELARILSFGAGKHYCLGANLARLEARTVLTEFVRRFASFEVHAADAVRVHSTNVRGFARLPITVVPR
jgi:cytochrome P450